MFHFTVLPPLSLYVHMPWCVHKCPYCDFNSHELKGAIAEQPYIDSLIADLEQDLPAVWGRLVETVFLGGGTPSLFSPEAIDRLLTALHTRLPITANAEITLEANPGSVEAGRFAEFRAAGVTRLSLGVQSFDADSLRRLGRIHGPHEAVAAAAAAHAAGFKELNLDLMYGLPGQSIAQARADLEQALALAPTHISHYQLTIEPNTVFAHKPPAPFDDDILWVMQQDCQARLVGAGYAQYEVSAYARDGHRCRHNLNYWLFGDYLGIGAGAHAKISDARQQRIARAAKARHPRAYMQNAAGPRCTSEQRILSPEEAGFEFMLNALRLNDGFETSLFIHRTGLPLATIEAGLSEAQSRGLLRRDRECIRPTERGRRFLNDLAAVFLPPMPHEARNTRGRAVSGGESINTL